MDLTPNPFSPWCRWTQATAGYTLDLSGFLRIWHNENENERYVLSQPYDDFAVDVTTGVITARRNFVGEIPMTLRLFDKEVSGVDAKLSFRLQVESESADDDAKRLFERMIERGEVDWLAPNDDWDNDGILNPYDWTPTSVTVFGGVEVEVNLTLDFTGADGTEAGNPWPIYNVWQLQAIAGKMVSAVGEMSDSDLLFDDDPLGRALSFDDIRH